MFCFTAVQARATELDNFFERSNEQIVKVVKALTCLKRTPDSGVAVEDRIISEAVKNVSGWRRAMNDEQYDASVTGEIYGRVQMAINLTTGPEIRDENSNAPGWSAYLAPLNTLVVQER